MVVIKRTVTMAFVFFIYLFAVNVCAYEYPITFIDVPESHWAYTTIMNMAEINLFKGTTQLNDNTAEFSPNKAMTRSELVAVVVRILQPEYDNNTTNIEGERWWKWYYDYAIKNELLFSNEVICEDLNVAISREEAAMVLVRALEKMEGDFSGVVNGSVIPDFSFVNDCYKDYVVESFELGLICGIDLSGTFAPKKNLTRAEAATMLNRLINTSARINTSDFVIRSFINQQYEYTWDDYMAFSDKQLNLFVDSFDDFQEYNKWVDENYPITTEIDSDAEILENKYTYTWSEFLALSDEMKERFIESFETSEAYEQWYNYANKQDTVLPWENGGKQPEDYTWLEFMDLSDTLKECFVDSFRTSEDYERWYESVSK